MLILLRIIQFTISILLFIYSNKYYVETSKVFENLDYKQLNDRLNQLQSPFSLVTDASYFAVNPTFVSVSSNRYLLHNSLSLSIQSFSTYLLYILYRKVKLVHQK